MKRLSEISALLNAKLVGNGDIEIYRVAPVEKASTGDIAFISSSKYVKNAASTRASAIITASAIEGVKVPQLIVRNPRLAFAKVLELLNPLRVDMKGVSRDAFVSAAAKIGENVSVYPFVYIGDDVEIGDNSTIMPGVFVGNSAKIGNGTLIYPNVFIGERCVIGNRVILQSGVRVGSDGFGYADDSGKHYKIPHVGIVAIEDDVELGANVTVDRAVMGTTLIKKGTKVDNLVHIGHNVVMGENCLLIAQVGISGSTIVGSNVVLGGQVGVAGHVEIGDNVVVGAQSGVSGNVKSGQVVSGLPPIPHKEWLRAQASIPKLPEMRKTVHSLKQRIEILEKKLNELREDSNGD